MRIAVWDSRDLGISHFRYAANLRSPMAHSHRGQEDAYVVVAGLVSSPSGRYFGFVIGGAAPAALAADWLTSAWDQNAGLYVCSPSAAVVEDVAGAWTAELLGLPPDVPFGFVTCVRSHTSPG